MFEWVVFTMNVKFKFTFAKITLCIHARRIFSIRKTSAHPWILSSQRVMSWLQVSIAFILIVGLVAQAPDEGYSREQLLPLTKFRQQHRRTIDGRFHLVSFAREQFCICASGYWVARWMVVAVGEWTRVAES